MSNSKSLTSSFLWSFLEQGGSKVIQMVVQIVLARLLSPEAFGTLAILLVVTQVADSVAQSGLGMALIQKRDTSSTSFSTAWWLSLGLAAILYGVLFVCSPHIAAFYAMPDLETYLKVLGIIVVFNSANSIQRSHLQKSMSFKSIFKATTVAALLSGVVGVAMAYLGFGVWALVGQSLFQAVVICVVMWLQLPWHPKLTFAAGEAHDLFSYGWKISVTGILNVLYSGATELILGKACSASELGIYSQGRKYPQAAIGVLNNGIANVLFPAYAALANDKKALRASIRKGLMLGSFVTIPACFLCAVVAEPLVAILLTEKWLPCVLVFQIACVSNSLVIMQLVNLRAYMALGDSALYMRLQIIKVVVGGAALWATALISHDIYATAWANLIVSVISIVGVDAVPANSRFGYSVVSQLKDLMPTFVLAALSSTAAWCVQLLPLGYVPRLVVQVAVFVAVYLAGSKLLHRPELSQVAALASGVLGRKN